MTKDEKPENPNSKYLIDLIVSQDQISQNWIKFLLGIESALATAYWVILKSSNEEPALHGLGITVSKILIPFIGVTAAVAITYIYARESRWGSWFIQRFVMLPQTPDVVFPSEPGVIDRQSAGYLSNVVRALCIAIVVGWVIMAVTGFVDATAS
jgi:hypothetical protein